MFVGVLVTATTQYKYPIRAEYLWFSYLRCIDLPSEIVSYERETRDMTKLSGRR
jgi:hypothetical protein